MMIENSNDGLTERPVCTGRAERKKQSAAHTLPKASSVAQSKGATNAMAARGASKMRRGSSPAEIKVVALVVAACSALVLSGLRSSNGFSIRPMPTFRKMSHQFYQYFQR
jgi:hypothetical protein